jgi:hypothetical protein
LIFGNAFQLGMESAPFYTLSHALHTLAKLTAWSPPGCAFANVISDLGLGKELRLRVIHH